MPLTNLASGLTGNPAFFNWARVAACVAAGQEPFGRRALDDADLVGPEVQRTTCGDARVLLAQRAGRRIARVDEEALARVRLTLVHRLELGDRHVDFAAHLEHVGIRRARSAQLVRHVLHGGDVRRDVLAHDTVAARGGPDEAALLEGEGHGHAVDLRLAGESEGSSSSEGSCRRRRSPHARTSSSLKALSRLIIGARWRTSWNRPDGAAPTEFVGESGVAKAGYSDSSRRSSSTKRSYSASGISGASRVWYSVLWCRIRDAELFRPLPRAGRHAVAAGGRHARVLRSSHAQAAMPAPTMASGSRTS